jgi:adenosylcobinamide amidohydrolase
MKKPMPLFDLDCQPPWLIARFADRQRMVSWSLNRPGFVKANTVAWLQVSNGDLPPEIDPLDFFQRRLTAHGLGDAVGLMTARDICRHHRATACAGGTQAEVAMTLGLSNGVTREAIANGVHSPATARAGTINLLVALSLPLSEGGLLETLSIAAAARTAALLSEEYPIVGTGTDCIVVACPDGGAGEIFAGLHTDIGTAVARAVYAATLEARQLWISEGGRFLRDIHKVRVTRETN